MKYPLDFYTSYNQFYINDGDSINFTDSIHFWTPESFEARLAIDEGILGIGTECYGPVKGEIEVLNAENSTTDLSAYDHIVEAGINIQSGIIQLLSCPDSAIQLELNINPGRYRVRIYSSNLASVIGDEGDDFYRIEIWPDENMERIVLKNYLPV